MCAAMNDDPISRRQAVAGLILGLLLGLVSAAPILTLVLLDLTR